MCHSKCLEFLNDPKLIERAITTPAIVTSHISLLWTKAREPTVYKSRGNMEKDKQTILFKDSFKYDMETYTARCFKETLVLWSEA